MKIALSLSRKSNPEGLSELLLSVQPVVNGVQKRLRAKSGIFIDPSLFDATSKSGIRNLSRMNKTPKVRYHETLELKVFKLLDFINAAFDELPTYNDLSSDWFANIIDRFNNPDRYMNQAEKESAFSFYQLAELYIQSNDFCIDYQKGIRVVVRAVSRFEGFVRATESTRKDFAFNPNVVTKNDIEDFISYARNEKALSEEYPQLFAKLLSEYPLSVKSGYNMICERGGNTIIKYIKKLKAMFRWLTETGRINNYPFVGIKIGCEKFGVPVYIDMQELSLIANTQMPTKHLEVQRDVFVFQCSIGCRVGDLLKLTESNITNGILEYTPHKTKDEGTQSAVARVPLTERAIQLIVKYRGKDEEGRLLPFISAQKYNDAIKEIFKVCGLNRSVQVRNSLTGENETKPISEVASSHMARKTFIGNVYFNVQDPNLIGKMSGHVEGSKAFARYRNIEDETLRGAVSVMNF